MSTPRIAYIVPLIHPEAAANWSAVCVRLHETAASTATADGSAILVLGCNEAASLPHLPGHVLISPVDLPPPEGNIYKSRGDAEAQRLKVVREDKGLKRLAALQQAKCAGATHAMMLDADDLVSSHVPAWIKSNHTAPGWIVRQGWLHRVGSNWIHIQNDFNKICGSSYIIQMSTFTFLHKRDGASDFEISHVLGDHIHMEKWLEHQGITLDALPFRGVIYRVGHQNNLSRRKRFIEFWKIRKSPTTSIKKLLYTRPITKKIRREFRLRSK